jgi:hypothetical protein
MPETEIKSVHESASTVSQEHLVHPVRHKVVKIDQQMREVQDPRSRAQVNPHVQDSLSDLAVARNNAFKRQSLLQRKSRIKSSRPLLDFRATSPEEKLNHEETSVPSATVR